MRIVYAGVNEGTCLSRYKAICALEPDTHFFDVKSSFEGKDRWSAFLERILFVGPMNRRINRDFLAFCREIDPDVIWIDKAIWAYPSTLIALRRKNRFLVQFLTDAISPRSARVWLYFFLIRKTLSLFDIVFTSNIDDVAWAQTRGVNAVLTHLGYDHERFNNTPLSQEDQTQWSCPIIFIGHHEPRTERYIRAILEAKLSIKIFGHDWQHSRLANEFPEAIQSANLSDSDYCKAIKGACIAICCVSELNYNQTAGRSYEIPASGTFLLAMRTEQHLESYVEGEEAEFFSSPKELVGKLIYYLEHDVKREAIALRGWRRCVTENYSWARYIHDHISNLRVEYAKLRR